ncbi:MAG TPA: hypothetical protein VKY24_22855 [Reyranella sp.]|nr:hypothetical protein [Reyranella sp.]
MWDEQQFSEVNDDRSGRLEQLRKQERVWFNWVCRLHDGHAGAETPQSAAILSIARRRWADARRALERAEARGRISPQPLRDSRSGAS